MECLLDVSDFTMTDQLNLRCIEDYRTYLVECYKQVKPPCVLDWPPQDKLQYVTPTLFTTEKPFLSQPTDVNAQYREVKLADIFAFSKERGKNLIVLLGTPGGGKSTLAWFMSREWARGQLYQEYRLLVHVSFRDHPKLLSAASLEDIIPHPDEESKQAVLQLLKQRKGNGVAIIIDSYDECGLYSNAPRVVDILLQVIPKASLLVMSRPVDIVNRSLVQHLKNITSVWLSEFSREQVGEYFSRNLEDGTEINMHFDQNVGLLGLCYTPINAAIVLFLLHVCKPTQLPSTQTELFECVTINLLIRYWEDQKGFEIEGPIKDIKKAPFYWQFKILCQQTYRGVFGNKKLIDDMPYEDLCNTPLDGIHDTLGLVSVQRLPNGGQGITYNHLLFRDFFAAYYLSTLAIEKQTARVWDLCQQNPQSPMLYFIAGLTKLNDKEIYDVLANFLVDYAQNVSLEHHGFAKGYYEDCDPKDPDNHHRLFTLLKCVYESQKPTLCREIISRVGDTHTRVGEVQNVYLSLSHYGISRIPQGCNIVGYFLGAIAATSRVYSHLSFNLIANLLQDSGIQILCEQMVQTYKQLQQPSPANTDIHLCLQANCITHKGVFVLSQVAQQIPAITGLFLSHNWSPRAPTWFVEKFVMPDVDIESCLKYLIESLASRISSKKVTISLSGNALCNKHVWHLLLLLMFSNNLFSLYLSGNCFGKLSVDLIAVALQHCMLKDLHLDNCGITSDSLSLLGKRLELNSTLELLDIQKNLLSQASLMGFFTHLRNNLSLARVWIDEWNNEYTKIFTGINTRRFHQGAIFLGCKVGKQASTYIVPPNVSSSLLDSSEFSLRQYFPQSLYGTIS